MALFHPPTSEERLRSFNHLNPIFTAPQSAAITFYIFDFINLFIDIHEALNIHLGGWEEADGICLNEV